MMTAGYRTVLRLVLSVAILLEGCDSDVKCRNDEGWEVDWYILYKLPGLTYLYMDERTNGFELSTKNMDSTSGSLANTLKPLLDFYARKTEGFGYMVYNDQPPEPFRPTVSATYGHSKGVVMLDKQTGVWLSHSTPRFPAYPKQSYPKLKNFWPVTGSRNAQTFLCVTFSYSEFKNIGLQLEYIHPYAFDYDIPLTFHQELKCVAQPGCYPKNYPWYRNTTLTSLNGRNFFSFAKYKRFGDDLYSGLIAKTLKESLYVKSWGRMRRPLPPSCSLLYSVYNVKELQLNGKLVSDTVDHSKWCVAPDSEWTCIADMNREMSQMERGGGAICIKDSRIAHTFFGLIRSYEKCTKINLPSPHTNAQQDTNKLEQSQKTVSTQTEHCDSDVAILRNKDREPHC